MKNLKSKNRDIEISTRKVTGTILAVALVVMASACATPKKQIVTMGMVSMTEQLSSKSENLKEAGPVQVQYCGGDKSVSSQDGEIGLMDELILRGQQTSDARYIKNAQFFQQGACFSMEGIAMK